MFLLIIIIFILPINGLANLLIKINRLGYEPEDIETAVVISEEQIKIENSQIYDAITDNILYTSSKISAEGGWHNASDYLSYVGNSATSTFQLLFVYDKNPDTFQDFYDASGNISSEEIFDRIVQKLQLNPDEFNGALILIHAGTNPNLKDKTL